MWHTVTLLDVNAHALVHCPSNRPVKEKATKLHGYH